MTAHFKIRNQSRHCISAKKGRRGQAGGGGVQRHGPCGFFKIANSWHTLSVFRDSSPKVAGVQHNPTLPSRRRECRACLGDDVAPSRAVTFTSFFFRVPEPDLLFRFYAFSPSPCLILIRFKSNRLLPFSDEPLAATPRLRTHLTSTTALAINPLHNLALSQARLLRSTTPFFKKPSPSTHQRRLKLTSTPSSIP